MNDCFVARSRVKTFQVGVQCIENHTPLSRPRTRPMLLYNNICCIRSLHMCLQCCTIKINQIHREERQKFYSHGKYFIYVTKKEVQQCPSFSEQALHFPWVSWGWVKIKWENQEGDAIHIAANSHCLCCYLSLII